MLWPEVAAGATVLVDSTSEGPVAVAAEVVAACASTTGHSTSASRQVERILYGVMLRNRP